MAPTQFSQAETLPHPFLELSNVLSQLATVGFADDGNMKSILPFVTLEIPEQNCVIRSMFTCGQDICLDFLFYLYIRHWLTATAQGDKLLGLVVLSTIYLTLYSHVLLEVVVSLWTHCKHAGCCPHYHIPLAFSI